MKSTKRMKPQPLQTAAEFFAVVDALVTLEAHKRKIEAERDIAKQKIETEFSARLAPVLAEIKGKLALAGDYADDHRSELLPDKKAKSFRRGLTSIGWRTGNRKVDTRSGVTVERAIELLKSVGLADFVRQKEEINKEKILDACKDDKTITVGVGLKHEITVAIADAGLKITQGEGFYVEPASDAAETMKPAEAAA
jgi:phage host-nuclease inhibitor protein Gam